MYKGIHRLFLDWITGYSSTHDWKDTLFWASHRPDLVVSEHDNPSEHLLSRAELNGMLEHRHLD